LFVLIFIVFMYYFTCISFAIKLIDWLRSDHPPSPPPPSPGLGPAWTRVYKLWPKADRGQLVSWWDACQSLVSWLVRRSWVASQSERERGQLLFLFQRCTFLPSSSVLLPSSVSRRPSSTRRLSSPAASRRSPAVSHIRLRRPPARQPSSSVFCSSSLFYRHPSVRHHRSSSTPPTEVRTTNFVTSSPAVSASCATRCLLLSRRRQLHPLHLWFSSSINFLLIPFTIRRAF